MKRPAQISTKMASKLLNDAGYFLDKTRKNAKHDIYYNPNCNKIYPLPRHKEQSMKISREIWTLVYGN